MRRLIAILVENEAGALSRVVGLFSQRNYNIETLSAAPTEDGSLSRITILTNGSNKVVEQLTKQLNKIVEVVKVVDLTDGLYLERTLMLVKIAAVGAQRDEICRMTDIFRGQIVDTGPSFYTVQLVGTQEKLAAFLEVIGPSAILEVASSGVCGLSRGEKALVIPNE